MKIQITRIKKSLLIGNTSFDATDIESFIFEKIKFKRKKSIFSSGDCLADEFLEQTKFLDATKGEKEKREVELNFFRGVEILYRQLNGYPRYPRNSLISNASSSS